MAWPHAACTLGERASCGRKEGKHGTGNRVRCSCAVLVWSCLQGEIFAAEGYGKVTGEVGVCIATSGPGATNLVTGLADALLDSVPMVAITGQVRAALRPPDLELGILIL